MTTVTRSAAIAAPAGRIWRTVGGAANGFLASLARRAEDVGPPEAGQGET